MLVEPLTTWLLVRISPVELTIMPVPAAAPAEAAAALAGSARTAPDRLVVRLSFSGLTSAIQSGRASWEGPRWILGVRWESGQRAGGGEPPGADDGDVTGDGDPDAFGEA